MYIAKGVKIIQQCISFSGAYALHSPSVARSRFTRMSVVDYYHNETHGDGLNVKVAHNVNTLNVLLPYLNGVLQRFSKRSTHRRMFRLVPSRRRCGAGEARQVVADDVEERCCGQTRHGRVVVEVARGCSK